MMLRAMIGVTLALAGAGVARADAQALTAAVMASPRPAPEVRLSLPAKDAEAYALRRAGIARTAVDRALAGEDMTGSLGFLCGLHPGADRAGLAAARGNDPNGRFLGAKLRLSFR